MELQMLFYLAFKNIISRKSSAVIILFISFSIMLMAVINSVFSCTENGIEKVFSRSFTGDLAVFPHSDVPLSLFGDETPVTGSLTKVSTVVPFDEIVSYLAENPKIEQFFPQVSGAAVFEFNNVKIPVCLFGVPAEQYVRCMTALTILEGTPFPDSGRGVMLSRTYAEQTGAKIGDTVQFIVADGPTFRIRAAQLSAIYEYQIENETLDRIVITDPVTVRTLMDMSDFVSDDTAIDEEKEDLLDADIDMESLFNDAEDVGAVFLEEAQESSAAAQSGITAQPESTSWNFIVAAAAPDENPQHIIRQLNRHFKEMSWPVKAVNWRTAAGKTSLYLYWMRLIFNIGIFIILAAGFIIINNTLVVAVLNRTQQIGTLRAQGASRLFISLQCMTETFMLTITAGILGCLLGAAATFFLTAARIKLSNAFLQQLFGTDILSVSISLPVIMQSLMLAVLLGLLGWIYPVRTALAVHPVQAMQGSI